jgi:hypothetical protein
MNKAELHLTKCPRSGKVIVPPGTSLADLHFVWECQQASISKLTRIYDRSRRTSTEQEHLDDAIARLALLAQAIYEAEIESTDDIERLDHVDGRRVPDMAFDGGCSIGVNQAA